MTSPQDAHLTPYVERLRAQYAERHPRSEALFARGRSVLPGGNSRYTVHFDPFPFYVDLASGATITDVDGHQYIDLVNNFTSLVHGHAHPAIVEALRAQALQGTVFGTGTEVEIELAEILVDRVRSIERVRFTNSGTEAVHYALRACRVHTGRNAVIKVEGGYDGGVDSMMVSVRTLSEAPGAGVPERGVPNGVARDTYAIPLNDVDTALEIIQRVGPRSAAVVVEPVQGLGGIISASDAFLQKVRQAARDEGCLFIADEVVTFRLSHGGVQEGVGLRPDVTILGKVIGGGMPVGAFGGSSDVMATMDQQHPAFLPHGGTFNANAMTMAAGVASLRELTPERIARINDVGRRLARHIDETAAQLALPLVTCQVGSLLQIHTMHAPPRSIRDRRQLPMLTEAVFLLMLQHGVFVAPGRLLMAVSTPMNERQVGTTLEAITSAFHELSGQWHAGR